MALTALTTAALLPNIRLGHTVASLGYPDMIAPPEMLERLMGDRYKVVKFRPDSDRICNLHGLPQRPIPDAASVFEALGATLDVYDIVQHRGDEILCDLNDPMKTPVYDFVLDVGTAEHCFNIGQAMKNMTNMVAQGGMIFHGNPYNSGNHGFYGLNPTLYWDWYTQNGFEIMYIKLTRAKSDEPSDVPPTARFKCEISEVNIFAAAQRKEVKPLVWPVQTKYKGSIGSKT